MAFLCASSLCTSSYGASLNKDILKNLYLKIGGGVMKYSKYAESAAFQSKAPVTNGVYNIGIGYKTNDVFRFDISLQCLKAHYKYSAKISSRKLYIIDHETRTNALALNAYYDFLFKNFPILPYVSAGLGIARHKSGTVYLKMGGGVPKPYTGATKYAAVWNLGFGAKCDLNKLISIDAGYMYSDYGKFKVNKSTLKTRDVKPKLKGHQITLSFNFNWY